ncbi:MAG: putative PEP-binding protein [Prochloraceae cyanobacterium]
MKQIYWLDRLLPAQGFLVGHKAFALSQLIKLGYPILNGFAIGATTMKEFLEIISNSEPLLADFPHSSLHLNVKNHQELQSLARKSRQQIEAATIDPDFISVAIDEAERLNSHSLILRASLQLPEKLKNKQFTGLFPAQICTCDRNDFERALKLVWGQLFSAKSILFWHRVGIGIERLNLAILVQPLKNAIASGTAEIDRDFIEIGSTWGLGHSLVKGEVLPDFYRIRKGTKVLDKKQLGCKMRAYRLNEGDLEPYLLTESEQAQYSLDEIDLNLAIETIDNLALQHQYIGSIEWILTKTPEPQFYITQFLRTNIFTLPLQERLMNKNRVLLKGLAASPGVAIAKVSIVNDLNEALPYFTAKTILVTKTIAPNWFPLLKQAAGIVSEVGGVTSHAAIIARELGIPAIVGARNATKLLENGSSILLDGTKGEIYDISEAENIEGSLNLKDTEPTKTSPGFAYPIATKLWVNLSQPSSIENAVNLPVDGIGLLRSELMLLDLISSEPLDSWLQTEKQILLSERLTELITQFAAAFYPRSVFYRSLDWHFFKSNNLGDKDLAYFQERGTYNYLVEPILFDLELKALATVQKSGYDNLNLILPFVRSVEEFIFCRDRVIKIGLNRVRSFKLWIMAEVPSVFFLLSEYVDAGVEGIAIGTNDLTELLLGTNRDLPESTTKFNCQHPATLSALKQLIKSAKKLGIDCSICGQFPVESPQSIEQLIRWGIDSISVEPQGVESTYKAIARAEQSLILKAAIAKLE